MKAGVTCGQCGQVHDTYAVTCPVTGEPLTHVSSHTNQRRPPDLSTQHVQAEDENLIGTTIGDRYLVRSLMGRGVCGPLFAAEHIDFQRSVAIRVLRPRFAAKDALHRVFHGEARAAWAVSHPNLCEVLDIGTFADHTPYVVMERLSGETLAARLARVRRLSVGTAVDILLQLLSALAATHARGVVHRDLRPENVFLVERTGCRPHVKLLDLGLARLTSATRIGQLWESLGKDAPTIPYYLAPERARGERGIDARTDLYGCGVILYEALTGQRPFESSSFQGLLAAIGGGRARPPCEIVPDLPAPLDAALAKAMASNRGDRYASAAEMQADLRSLYELSRRQRFARGEEISAIHTQAVPEPPRERLSTQTTTEDVTLPPTPAAISAVAAEAADEEDPTETMTLGPELKQRVRELTQSVPWKHEPAPALPEMPEHPYEPDDPPTALRPPKKRA